MTAEQWIINNIPTKIEEDTIRLNEYSTVPIATFCTFFRDSLEDETVTDMYQALCGPHTFTWGGQQITRTGIELGYQPTFDQWRIEQVFGYYEVPPTEVI